MSELSRSDLAFLLDVVDSALNKAMRQAGKERDTLAQLFVMRSKLTGAITRKAQESDSVQ